MSCRWCCGVPPARPPPPANVRASVTQQHASIVSITGISNGKDGISARGIGVLIHPTLILTTHSTISSPTCIKDAEISFCRDIASRSYVKRKFVPEIFFQTDTDLDLTVVSCEIIAPEHDTLALDTTKLSRRALRKGHNIFVMGCQVQEPEDIVILEGRIAGLEKADRLNTHLRFQTGDGLWMPGSAGFDKFGTFSFIVTRPPKLQDQEAVTGSSAMGGLFSSKHPKQWASCIKVVKEWVEPLWRMNRDEVFQGLQLNLDKAIPVSVNKGASAPPVQGDSIRKQNSVVSRSSVVPNTTVITVPIRQATLEGVKNVEKLPTKPERITPSPPQKPAEKSKTTTKSIAVETAREDPGSDFDIYSSKNSKVVQGSPKKQSPDQAAMCERRARKEAFLELKKKNGLKKVADKATRTTEKETGNVSVQTELFVTEADVKPMIIVSRPGSPEVERQGGFGEGPKGRRERWSLPADGHGLDFMKGEGEESPPPTVIRRGRASMPSTGMSIKEAESDPASWMDKYYARGRSRSEYPSRSSSAGTTPPRSRRQVVSDAEAYVDSEDAASLSGSSSRSMRAGSAYFKPTISYMQKRNLAQRDSILARQASQKTILPRWS